MMKRCQYHKELDFMNHICNMNQLGILYMIRSQVNLNKFQASNMCNQWILHRLRISQLDMKCQQSFHKRDTWIQLGIKWVRLLKLCLYSIQDLLFGNKQNQSMYYNILFSMVMINSCLHLGSKFQSDKKYKKVLLENQNSCQLGKDCIVMHLTLDCRTQLDI